ncbi:MAG TPA: hypothetical protein VHJ34_13930, partial [Actinomycetota bacterium]|nr:hypothetical protein [Actinomycetota bacterium]
AHDAPAAEPEPDAHGSPARAPDAGGGPMRRPESTDAARVDARGGLFADVEAALDEIVRRDAVAHGLEDGVT